ncbi:MAG: type IV-A pilus assembly ATPase PilB [Actinobacteria bacterium]|nr:type IV-A pilus assembly ATPase PilB [Actinomycetota bacterium]
MRQLGQILIEEGLISDEQLRTAQEIQQQHGRSLGRVLIDRGHVTERDLVRALATQIGMDFVDLSDEEVDATAVTAISETLARRYNALPIGYENGRLVVAMSDPANVFALDDIRAITGLDVKSVVATKEDIADAIKRYHRMSDEIEEMAQDMGEAAGEPHELADIKTVTDEAPIVKFVNLLITQAVNDGASDIHIEPAERDMRVRFRIDGVLHEIMHSPKSIQSGVTSRLKIMAEIDIAERRIPQDGRIGLVVGGKQIDLRVSTLPTVYGEKLVMRILDKTSILLELKDLGFLEENYARFESSFRKPYGMILVTGPTGSGKSTTLYATLNVINRPEVNIVTTEDPVEYRLAGVNQVQVNVKAGLTFASALRSILRQDPDIVLVGEMRDRETAHIGIEAALTGHLVLSTLHTNDAPSAVTRLTEMGIEPFLVGSAIDAVLAQRLARRLCSKCKEPYRPEMATLQEAGLDADTVEQRPEVFRAVGCKACGNTGYKGRLALHEVMSVTEDIERLTVERASSEEIKRVAISQGMRTLREDGLAKVLLGMTTIEEVARVVV